MSIFLDFERRITLLYCLPVLYFLSRITVPNDLAISLLKILLGEYRPLIFLCIFRPIFSRYSTRPRPMRYIYCIASYVSRQGEPNPGLCCDQLLEGARWCYTLPAVSSKKVFFFNSINHLLTKLLRSKLLNSVLVNKNRYILTKQAWTITLVNSRHYWIVCCAYSNSIEGTCLLHYYAQLCLPFIADIARNKAALAVRRATTATADIKNNIRRKKTISR